jgi:Uncharacterized conserved protein (COG2071)
MRIPIIRGVIDRRILVNYHVDPTVLAMILPAPFSPKLVHGVGMAGICLIRLKKVRPTFLPAWMGISSENAAHRVAVTWEEGGTVREGVYIPRRDTNSGLNSLVGGRLFSGIHHHAQFKVEEATDDYHLAIQSDDGQTLISLHGQRVKKLPPTSVFDSVEEASAFFQRGSLGYSATPDPSRFQGLELKCQSWQVEPIELDEVHSSYFDNESLFPRGSIEFDCALLMRGLEHEWHGRADFCCAANSNAASSVR